MQSWCHPSRVWPQCNLYPSPVCVLQTVSQKDSGSYTASAQAAVPISITFPNPRVRQADTESCHQPRATRSCVLLGAGSAPRPLHIPATHSFLLGMEHLTCHRRLGREPAPAFLLGTSDTQMNLSGCSSGTQQSCQWKKTQKHQQHWPLAHVPWIIGAETWLNTEIWKGRGKRSPGRRQKIMDTLSVVSFCAFQPTQSPIYSCGFSRNTNPKTRCTESSVHGIKASIHHVSSVSWLYSFCLLLSSDYNLLINNTLMIFSMPIYFLRHWLGFLRLLKKYKYLYKQISILKWSLTTYRCNMTSTKNQSIFDTWNPLLAMKMGVAEIAPGKDPHSPFKKSIWINIRSSLGPWTRKTLQQVGEKPPEQQHRGTSMHQPDVQIQLYGTAAPQIIYSWTDERLEDLNSIHGHISRIKSDYTRTEKTANIISQKTASSNFLVIDLK